MESNTPSHRYFRSMDGSWSGPFQFVIPDGDAFRTALLSRLDRIRFRTMSVFPRIVGSAVLSTTVDYASNGSKGTVLHTTRISKGGVTFYKSTELLQLHESGRSFTMEGEFRIWPMLWETRRFDARGEVLEDATGATYHITGMGPEIRQVTKVVAGGLDLRQETDWSRATVLLRRRAGAARLSRNL